MAAPLGEIESLLSRRYGRPTLFTPSGRLALFVGLTGTFSPGDRLLMSPLDDDVVVIVVLAAGLRPVMAPIDIESGNIDVDRVPGAVWSGLAGVLTTNLYGVPEDSALLRARCDRHGLVLVEDVAHALAVDDGSGAPVGHRGDLIVVSLSKQGRGRGGGALLVPTVARREGLREDLDGLLVDPTPGGRLRTAGARAAAAIGQGARLRRVRDRLRGPARPGHRMSVDPDRLSRAVADAPDLGAFDPWIGIDRRRYRDRPDRRDLRDAVRATGRAFREVDEHRSAVARLTDHPAAVGGIGDGPRFRVPWLVADRPRAERVLAVVGIGVDYVYDPPLDDLLGEAFVDPSPVPGPAREWAAHVLPLDPAVVDGVSDALERDPAAFAPARPG